MKTAIAAGVLALAIGGAARAEVAEQWDTGFTSRNVVQVKARADRAYAALGELGRWWTNEHTYSGAAANMTLPLQAGACFCETWPAGSVAHGRVAVAWPAQGMLRFEGALGPLQEMGVSGVMTWKVTPKPNGMVEVVQTYTVGGGRPGLAKMVGAGVDGVVAEALKRYARYVETGKPE